MIFFSKKGFSVFPVTQNRKQLISLSKMRDYILKKCEQSLYLNSKLKCPRSIDLSGCMISFLNSFCFLSWLDFFVCRPVWGHMMNKEAFF